MALYAIPWIACALLLAGSGWAQDSSPLLLQSPTLNRTHIGFVYAGRLWSVPRGGGEAKRLTGEPGQVVNCVFSPDGKQIAFTAELAGNKDVFVMSTAGGAPRRLTWHPADDVVAGWTPDGQRILFSSGRGAYVYQIAKLFTVAVHGGFPEELPLPLGYQGSYSPDGNRLAYVPLPSVTTWKHYRGGRTTLIWLANLSTSAIEKVPRENSNDFNPMWVGDRVYFLSDRNGPVSLYCYDTRARRVREVIRNRGFDLKSASAGPDAIVYEQFGSLHLYDWTSGLGQPVSVRIAEKLPEVGERQVNVSRSLANPHLSPDGEAVAFEARGEIIVVRLGASEPLNLTNTPGVMERQPAWSPDGKFIAYFSDESGEYALHIRRVDGKGQVARIALPGGYHYYSPVWSPDGRKIAFVDYNLVLWYVDITQGRPVKVDADISQLSRFWIAEWSPDSQWITYPRRLKNHMYAVSAYSLAQAESTQITDGMAEALYPVFDKNGRYLYFTLSTDVGPANETNFQSATRQVTRRVCAVVLRKGDASPLSPAGQEQVAPTAAVRIDFDDISRRIVPLPLPAVRYEALLAARPGLIYAMEAAWGGKAGAIHRFDLSTVKSETLADRPGWTLRASYYSPAPQVSRDGSKALYRQGDRLAVAPLTGTGGERVFPTERLEVRAEARAEWRQMYREAWRIQQHLFYDPGYHGLDLKIVESKYAPFLENIASRRDLYYLFREMLGELSAGHMIVQEDAWPATSKPQIGLLGADFRVEDGRYRLARIYQGESWNPVARAPLAEPGIEVSQGEYLLSVNGRDLTASDDIYSLLEGSAEKPVRLRVGPDASGSGAREVVVRPVADEEALRNLDWVEANRRKVGELTGGRVAYIPVPDAMTTGWGAFVRYFYAQRDKEAAILDARFNDGGRWADDLVDLLNRKPLERWSSRCCEDESRPRGAIFGPKVLLINEFVFSGGESLARSIRQNGAATLVGRRTAGAAIAPIFVSLMDGGAINTPSYAAPYNLSGQWVVENQGVKPDIDVEQLPELVRQGRDPQLEKAVAIILEKLKKNPPPNPKRPAYPKYQNGTNGLGTKRADSR